MERPRVFFATVLRDPLSEVTRKERLYLLGTSMVGIAILRTGLVPTQISALGIEFQRADQQTFLFLLGLVVFYFLVAFVVYATSDFLAWWEVYREAMAEIGDPRGDFFVALARKRDEIMRASGMSREEMQRQGTPPEIERLLDADRIDPEGPTVTALQLTRTVGVVVATLRALFEYLLPLVVGVYAVYILMF